MTRNPETGGAGSPRTDKFRLCAKRHTLSASLPRSGASVRLKKIRAPWFFFRLDNHDAIGHVGPGQLHCCDAFTVPGSVLMRVPSMSGQSA
jgi:hypothetical protein